ncbi:efflux RND transporter permease subunit [Marinilabiliaceae bacterium JC040]|nr:efflux RND transporter permease subunit [Marinilabiliaceae bacterium JC040]
MDKKLKISSFTIIVIFVVFALIGLAVVPLLPIKLSPSNKLPSLSVNFSMKGSASRVVELEATSRIESILNRVTGVKEISSQSRNGSGMVNITLDKHVSIEQARFEASTLMRQVWDKMPDNVTYPQIQVSTPDKEAEGPFLTYTLNSPIEPIDIQHYAEEFIKNRIGEIPNIKTISISGATPYEWSLIYDVDIINKLGISRSDIEKAIRGYNKKTFLGLGKTRTKDGKFNSVRLILSSKINNSVFNIDDILVKSSKGRLIKLSDIVKLEHKIEKPTRYFRINGLNSIYIAITPSERANQLDLSKKIYSKIEEIKKDLPDGYEMYKSYDSTDHIRKELNKIYYRSGITVLILLLFVFFITRRLKYLFLIICSLSVNLFIACILYYSLGLEIQLYSLAGITISLSLIIDNTIIMTDYLMHRNDRRVFLPILAATLTTIGALSIIFFLDEKVRLNLVDFSLVVMINLLISLLVALFFVPAMVEKIGLKSKKKDTGLKQGVKKFIIRITRIYYNLIRFVISYKKSMILIFILSFGLPVFMLPKEIDGDGKFAKYYNETIGSSYYQNELKPIVDKYLGGTLRLFVDDVFEHSYFTRNDNIRIIISSKMPNGTTLNQINSIIVKLERFIKGFSGVKQFQTNISSARKAQVVVSFTKDAIKAGFPYELNSKIITKVISLGGGSWSVYGLPLDRGYSNSTYGGSAGRYGIKLYGYNYDELWAHAESLRKHLLTYRRIKVVNINSHKVWGGSDYREFTFDMNKKLMAVNNLQPYTLFSYLNNAYSEGSIVDNIIFNGNVESIRLNSKQALKNDIWLLKNMGREFNDSNYKLSRYIDIKKIQSPQDIYKINQQYSLVVQFDYIGSDKKAEKLVKKEIKQLSKTLPIGYSVKPSERGMNWNSSKGGQYFLIFLLITIIFFTTSILFNSLKQPFAVIFVIPISFIGVFLTFLLFDLNFDQGGYASFILLSGITVNASIYILNEYNNLKKSSRKISSLKLYLKAWNSKIIPIMLTILSTILGFIPFLIGGKEAFWFPLAAGTIGGLIMSLIGIFVFLPIFVVGLEKGERISFWKKFKEKSI